MLHITEFFLRHPRFANLILVLIILAGVASALTMRRQGYPPVNLDMVKITTEYPGASPEDVEINVTELIEDELQDVEDIEKIESLSMENYSILIVMIDPDSTDPDRVRRDIRDAVDRVTELPQQVVERPKVEEIRSTNVPTMEVALTGDVPETELRTYARNLEKKLKTAHGIGRTEKVGYRKREIHVEVDRERIHDRHISLGEIMDGIRSRNIRSTGGTLESYPSEKTIVTFSEYENPLDVAEVVVRSTFSGPQLTIADVADVEEGFEEEHVIPRANGSRSISIIIRPRENADVVRMSDDVRRIVESFRRRLPDTMQIHFLFDDSDYIRSLLRMVRDNGLIGFVLVMLVLFLALDFRTSLWTAFGIPIAICGALALFPVFGLTINFLTLTAMVLVLGILVDDAIVFAESISSHKERIEGALAATMAGVRAVFWPVTASVLTTMVAFAPMLFMSGMIGKFVIGMPLTVIVMLGFSLFESVWFLPAHLQRVPSAPTGGRRALWIGRLRKSYRRLLTWCLSHRMKLLVLYALVAIGVVALSVWRLPFILFSYEDPDAYWIVAETPLGTSLAESEEAYLAIEKVVREVVPKEMIQSIIGRVGNHDTNVYGITKGNFDNHILTTVRLKLAENRDERSEPYFEEVERRVKSIPGLSKVYVAPYDDGPPVGKPVTITYSTVDDELRRTFEQETMAFLESMDGVYGVESNNIPGKEELRLILDYKKAARLGLTARQVAQTVRAAFDGEVVTSIRREGEEIDYRVRLKGGKQFRMKDVLDLEILNATGDLVPLASFAHIEESSSPAVIHHTDATRSVTVTAEIDEEHITSMQANDLVRSHFAPEAAKHADMLMEFGGEEKETVESMQDLFFAFAVAIVAIYFLLVLIFDSFTQPFLIMAVIPFAIIGVCLAFLLHGLPFGFVAMIGVVGLAGVVVNDSIVMVSRLNKTCGKVRPRMEAILDAAEGRFRPIMLTTITTCAGLFPTAYGIAGDLPFIRPMVLAVAWGLIFATVITLILIPLLYSLVRRMER